VPALPTLAFIAKMVEELGCQDFAYLAATGLRLNDLGSAVRRGLRQATTLGEALNGYCSHVDHEQSHVLCHIDENDSGDARISGKASPSLAPELSQYSEWLLIGSLMLMIHQATGRVWRPRQIAFQSRPTLGKAVWKAYPDTQLLVGQAETGISFSGEILDLPWSTGRSSSDAKSTGALPAQNESHHWDFPKSLRAAIRPYLADGYPSIELAAELSGMSVRTLQWRLQQYHLSYSGVVQQLRLEIATELLDNSKNSVLDTACEVGFSDPSHFSRAFRQMTGVSPSAYRRQQLAA
jgi:AraC-like DNA-binding protein